MWFHAPQEIIEHPAILLDTLCAGGISVRLDNSPCRAIGHVDELEVCVQVHSRRFHANLSVDIRFSPSSAAAHRISKLFAELKRVASEAIKDEPELRAILCAMREQHQMEASVANRISAVLGKIDISVVHSPIEDELGFVMTHYGTTSKIAEMVCTIQKQQELVSHSVSAQQFEDAARHRDERERLMDNLYDLCTNATK